MALKEDYEKPYAKHQFDGYQDRTSLYNKMNKEARNPLNHSSTLSWTNPRCAKNLYLPEAYQKNIVVSNNEIYRLVEASKPTHIQSMVYPEPVLFKRDPSNKYSSIRV